MPFVVWKELPQLNSVLIREHNFTTPTERLVAIPRMHRAEISRAITLRNVDVGRGAALSLAVITSSGAGYERQTGAVYWLLGRAVVVED